MRRFKGAVLEALVLAIVGLLVALAANALSPGGLRLTRNYFPIVPTIVVTNTGADPVVVRLQQLGLKVAVSNEVAQLFRDPAYEQGLIAFVDARNDAAYQSGHIPGSW